MTPVTPPKQPDANVVKECKAIWSQNKILSLEERIERIKACIKYAQIFDRY